MKASANKCCIVNAERLVVVSGGGLRDSVRLVSLSDKQARAEISSLWRVVSSNAAQEVGGGGEGRSTRRIIAALRWKSLAAARGSLVHRNLLTITNDRRSTLRYGLIADSCNSCVRCATVYGTDEFRVVLFLFVANERANERPTDRPTEGCRRRQRGLPFETDSEY